MTTQTNDTTSHDVSQSKPRQPQPIPVRVQALTPPPEFWTRLAKFYDSLVEQAERAQQNGGAE